MPELDLEEIRARWIHDGEFDTPIAPINRAAQDVLALLDRIASLERQHAALRDMRLMEIDSKRHYLAVLHVPDTTTYQEGERLAQTLSDLTQRIPAITSAIMLSQDTDIEIRDAAAMAIVRAVANPQMTFDFWTCPHCGARFVWGMGMQGKHADDCLVTQARALLAGETPQPHTTVVCMQCGAILRDEQIPEHADASGHDNFIPQAAQTTPGTLPPDTKPRGNI